MKKLLLFGLIVLFATNVYAGTIERYSVYPTTGSVTATNLNGNFDKPYNEINGNLDNDNADTASGFRFYEVLATNPSVGTEGRMVYNTTTNTLGYDNGSAYITVVDNTNAQSIAGTKTFTDTLTVTGITMNDDGANGVVAYLDNSGTNMGLDINQAGILASSDYALKIASGADQDNSSLVFIQDSNASSNATASVYVDHDGTSRPLRLDCATGVSKGHINFGIVATVANSVEGDLYADDDGILMYYSNSGFQACNTASDFAEVMQCEGNKSQYNIGDVFIISDKNIEKSEYESRESLYDNEGKHKGWKTKRLDTWFNDGAKKVTTTNTPYDTKVIGVWCEKASKLDPTMAVNDKLVVVSLIGLVKVNVCDEGGNITAGDLLVTSSKKGHAMKGVIDSFDKIGSIIGKAREDITFGTKKTAFIEMVVGVK